MPISPEHSARYISLVHPPSIKPGASSQQQFQQSQQVRPAQLVASQPARPGLAATDPSPPWFSNLKIRKSHKSVFCFNKTLTNGKMMKLSLLTIVDETLTTFPSPTLQLSNSLKQSNNQTLMKIYDQQICNFKL